MTASDNLSPSQFQPEYTNLHKPGVQLPMFMTPHEIGGMMSADHDVNVRHMPARLRSSQEHAARKYGDGEPVHMDDIANQVRASGGVEKPVRVIHLPSGVSSLYDGNNRTAAALDQNKLVPVDHYFDHHAVMHDIKKDNQDVCYTCGKVPTEYWKR